MLLLILLIIFAIFSYVAAFESFKHNMFGGEFVFTLLSIILSLALISSIVEICVLPSEAEAFVTEKAYHEDLVKSLNENASVTTLNRAITYAIRDNERILTHRRNVDNIFYGVYYSKKISEQELIELPNFYLKNE